jgi:hypothetical protein
MEWRNGAADCAAGNVMEVRTGQRYIMSDLTGTHVNTQAVNEGFSFLVP